MLLDDLQPPFLPLGLAELNCCQVLALLLGGLGVCILLLLLRDARQDLLGNLLPRRQVVERPPLPLHVDPRALEQVLLVLARDGDVEDAGLADLLEEVGQAVHLGEVVALVLLPPLLELLLLPLAPGLQPAAEAKTSRRLGDDNEARDDVLVHGASDLRGAAGAPLVVLGLLAGRGLLLALLRRHLEVVPEQLVHLLEARQAGVEHKTPVAADPRRQRLHHLLRLPRPLELQPGDLKVFRDVLRERGLPRGGGPADQHAHGAELAFLAELPGDLADVAEDAVAAKPAGRVAQGGELGLEHVLRGGHDEVERQRFLQVSQGNGLLVVTGRRLPRPVLHQRDLVRVANLIHDALHELGLRRRQRRRALGLRGGLVDGQEVRRLRGDDLAVLADLPHQAGEVADVDHGDPVLAVAEDHVLLDPAPSILEEGCERVFALTIQHAAPDDQGLD
mmetsp:Transcript_88089/g.254232  ORF Transcript_88089/g.254232 Transcript_88089/m.254232 type:complete len:448 (+) Transcript_88089:315-1658(+)